VVDVQEFFAPLRWTDRRPLVEHLEPYRARIFQRAFNELDDSGRPQFNLILCGRAKKNWKSADLALACFYAALVDSPDGNEVYIVANDEDQAGDDLALCKALIRVNTVLDDCLRVKQNMIERKDGGGFIEILPAQDAIGVHGKTYRLLAVDEIHGHRTYDLLEALALDPTRQDAQQWITSYASIYHKPGVPLFDLCRIGRAGLDPRMLFSWYAADYCTDPDFAHATPEDRANPSRAQFKDAGYLAQQQRRLPAHKYRRLHLNLPGLPEGSAYTAEMAMDAIDRGVRVRPPAPGVQYVAFVDMSGGSSDDAVLAVAHRALDGRLVLDCIVDQGPRPPFDPNKAVERFVGTLREYRCSAVTGDRYAGETFRAQFTTAHITYHVSPLSKHELYEALEPLLNAHAVVLLDAEQAGTGAVLEQQLLGLVWRGGKIDHPAGEHDDFANAAAGAVVLTASPRCQLSDEQVEQLWNIGADEESLNPYGLSRMETL
jgi:hypothetical protein